MVPSDKIWLFRCPCTEGLRQSREVDVRRAHAEAERWRSLYTGRPANLTGCDKPVVVTIQAARLSEAVAELERRGRPDDQHHEAEEARMLLAGLLTGTTTVEKEEVGR